MRKSLKHRRRIRHHSQIKTILFCSVIFSFVLCVGYAAFSSNLNITAKGNISSKKISSSDLKSLVVTSGDGLYNDAYDSNRYVYRGANPDNYISFNDELWRIVSIESDGVLKIINNNSVANKEFDVLGIRNNANNTFCQGMNTCNAWNKVTGVFSGLYKSGTVSTDSTLNTYLNNEYFNLLSDDKNHVVNYTFNLGGIHSTAPTISEVVTAEKRLSWDGKVGLLTVTDFMKACLSSECLSIPASRVQPFPCKNDNFLAKDFTYRLITPTHGTSYGNNESSYTYYIHEYGSIGDNPLIASGQGFGGTNVKTEILPVVHLSSNIFLDGNGTENNPYTIKTN